MRISRILAGLAGCAALPLLVLAQGPELAIDASTAFKIALPPDAPLSLQSADWSQSKATARGGAVVVDLRSTLLLKNTSNRTVRGVSLLVLAQEVTPGGKASVTVPSLDIPPGQVFPVKIDLRLMRPPASGVGTLVDVGLDGVLFDDLTFYGPNRLNSRRGMIAWEMEARRDRKAMLAALNQGGPETLRKSLLTAMASRASQRGLEMTVARTGRSTNVEPGRSVELAALKLPDSPVEITGGTAVLSDSEARLPKIELRNTGKRPVRFVELGWLVKDDRGEQSLAGALSSDQPMAPGQKATVERDTVMRFLRPGGSPAKVASLGSYVRMVEFADGDVWVPGAQALEDARRQGLLPISGEEDRLIELYRRKGLDAVVEQLRRMR